MTKKLTNGFATKKDIARLEAKMNKRFEQVDKRFEQVDKRFEQVDKRFEQVDKRFEQVDRKLSWFRAEIKEDLEIWFKDNYRKFEHRWQQQIDPILKEIEKHREEEVVMAEQYHRLETLMLKIADKVGVEVTDYF
jgi:archaellum component FlaC